MVLLSLLPLLLTGGIYGLLKKKVKVTWILLGLMALGIVGAWFGIFAV